jgi:hypothetical protein
MLIMEEEVAFRSRSNQPSDPERPFPESKKGDSDIEGGSARDELSAVSVDLLRRWESSHRCSYRDKDKKRAFRLRVNCRDRFFQLSADEGVRVGASRYEFECAFLSGCIGVSDGTGRERKAEGNGREQENAYQKHRNFSR